MTCCKHCEESADFFDQSTAQKQLRKYRKKGPFQKSTRLLIDRLRRLDIRETTLLDVGGGIGTIQHELLGEGIAGSLLVEASPAYLEAAEHESRRRGNVDRTSYRYGDFVDLAPDLPGADLVTLDRVICCYPDMKRLIRASAGRAARWYGVVYPKERWYNRVFGKVGNAYCWARGMEFRIYIHAGIDETIRDEGFAPLYGTGTVLWKVAVYERRG